MAGTPRDAYNDEIMGLKVSLSRGENPYGGINNALNSIWTNFAQPAGVSGQEHQGAIYGAYGQPVPQDSTPTPTYSGGGGSGTSGAATGPSAAEIAYNNQQIESLNGLLGTIGAQRDPGINNIRGDYGQRVQQLNEGKTKAMNNYAAQDTKNLKAKQTGIEGVDSFANNSNQSLQRMLQRGNASASSVGRDLIPYLVSKSAGTRRTGVFNQAGENTQAIADARGDANDQYNYNIEGLGNAQKGAERDFLSGLLNRENDVLGQRRGLQAANSDTAGAAGSQNEINSRMGQLQALFGQYIPSYTAKAINLQKPELGQYTIDPAQARLGTDMPTESRYYGTMFNQKKKDEQAQNVLPAA